MTPARAATLAIRDRMLGPEREVLGEVPFADGGHLILACGHYTPTRLHTSPRSPQAPPHVRCRACCRNMPRIRPSTCSARAYECLRARGVATVDAVARDLRWPKRAAHRALAYLAAIGLVTRGGSPRRSVWAPREAP